MGEPSTQFTLVLGAGSSQAFGLPLGFDLRNQIASDLNIRFDSWGRELDSGSYEIVDALRLLVRTPDGRTGDINPHRAAAVQIAEAMPFSSSIDEYVERYGDDELKSTCAKIAIAKAILEAERRSKLFVDTSTDEQNPLRHSADSWISFFLRDVTRGLPARDVPMALQKFSVVNFNYDRCFEHFVFFWLKQFYEFTESDAAEAVERINIWHPYGKLGDLPFQSSVSALPFGARVTSNNLLHIKDRIRTYSEAIDGQSQHQMARERLAEARKIVFLGFGFHDQNMRLLSPPEESPRSTARCYGTAYDVPKPRWDVFRARVRTAFGVHDQSLFFDTVSGTCEDLWRDYGETIIS